MKIYYSSNSYYRLGDDYYINLYGYQIWLTRGFKAVTRHKDISGWVLYKDKEIEEWFKLMDIARL